MTIFLTEMGNVQRGKRVGGFYGDCLAGLQTPDGLPGFENRQRAVESDHIEFGHLTFFHRRAGDCLLPASEIIGHIPVSAPRL